MSITSETITADTSGSVVYQYAFLSDGMVTRHTDDLYITIASFRRDIGGNRGIYDGVAKQAVVDDDINYVYLDEDGVLQVNVTGYPTDKTYLALARVKTAGGVVTNIYQETILLASSSAAIGTCVIGYPVDAGVRGGSCGVSSNNTVASITFDDVGESRNRWNGRPPQNYTSGDLILRLLCSCAGTPGNKDTWWQLEYSFLSSGTILPSSYQYSTNQTVEMDSVVNDTLFEIDFTIPSANFDNTKDMMAFYLQRDGDNANDDCSLMVHVHLIELVYTGYKVAGQAGQ